MWRVRTGSRLHLGLLSLPADGERWPDRDGQRILPARRFGGVGLMIDTPGIALRAEPAQEWGAEGSLAGRALAFARQTAAAVNLRNLEARRIILESVPPEHVGLGTGTQLGLAVAATLAASWGRDESIPHLARYVGRGLRSALGVHGFAQGGFLVEAGKSPHQELSPLVARVEWPADWRIVLALPGRFEGRHGDAERSAFTKLCSSLSTSEALCRLVLLGMLPALAEGDLEAFGEAAFDYNVRVGEVFAPEQGGPYADAAVSRLVEFFRRQGVRGVGQSSWGPAVFAFVGDPERADDLTRRARNFLPSGAEVWVAHGLNRGAAVGQGCGGPGACQ